MENISFDTLPKAMEHLIGKIEKIETLLSENRPPQEQDENRYVDIVEIQKKVFHQWKKQTIYNKCYLGQLPHSRVGGRLLFHLKECREWQDTQLQQGKIKALSQLQDEAKQFVANITI